MTSAPPTPAAPALREPVVDRPAVREHLPAATCLLSFAIAAEIFSGNWGVLGAPVAFVGLASVGAIALLMVWSIMPETRKVAAGQ